MKLSSVGALGALFLAASAAPALAAGYYDAYPPGAGPGGPPPGPPPGAYCPPAPCPCPPAGPYAEAQPWAYQQPAPEGDYEGPPPEEDNGFYYGSGPGPDEGADVLGPGVYYDDNGAFLPEAPYFGFGGGYWPGGYWPGEYGYWPGGFGRGWGRHFGDHRGGFGGGRGFWTGGRIEGERPAFGGWGRRPGFGSPPPAMAMPRAQAAGRAPMARPAARAWGGRR